MRSIEHLNDFKHKKKIRLIDIAIPIFPILLTYNYGLSSLGILLMLAVAIIYLLIYRHLYINKWLLFFGLYAVVHQLILMLFLDDVPSYMINDLIMFIVVFFIIFVLSGNINEDNLYRVWKPVGVVVILGLFYHAICVYFLNYNVTPIRILPIPSEGSIVWMTELPRPMSFFTEPASYSLYMLPLLFLAIRKNNLIFAVVITLSIFLSTSSSGILLSILMWCYLAFTNNKIKNQHKIILIIMLCSLIAAILYLPIFDYALNKLSSTDIQNNIRLSKGYEIYTALPFIEKSFGIIAPNLHDYLLSDKLWFPWLKTTSDSLLGYTNTISGIFIQYGLFGGIIYLFIYYKMFTNNDKKWRGYLFIVFISSFGQSVLFNGFFILQFVLYCGLNNKTLNNIDYLNIYVKTKE